MHQKLNNFLCFYFIFNENEFSIFYNKKQGSYWQVIKKKKYLYMSLINLNLLKTKKRSNG